MGKRVDRETPIHRSIVNYLRNVLPKSALVHHSRNEGNRKGKAGVIDGARGKDMGICAGWPDLEIVTAGQIVFLEVKAEGGRMQPTQRRVRDMLEAQGFRYAVVRSIADVRETFADWGIPTKEIRK